MAAEMTAVITYSVGPPFVRRLPEKIGRLNTTGAYDYCPRTDRKRLAADYVQAFDPCGFQFRGAEDTNRGAMNEEPEVPHLLQLIGQFVGRERTTVRSQGHVMVH